MTFEEFETFVREVLSAFDSYAYGNEDGFYIESGTICQKHETDGASGGNCWGDEAEWYSNDKAPSDFLPLDLILKEVAPTITYLEYKDIEKLITQIVECDREYYGNYTNYDIYKLDIRKLYDKLFGE